MDLPFAMRGDCEGLTAELVAAGLKHSERGPLVGVSTCSDPPSVVVHLADNLTAADRATVMRVVQAHAQARPPVSAAPAKRKRS